ncbi:MAG: hypothetical protein FIA82_05230 [Melioribacter sp.]|nr:hypothetical protein [Melioribacter sp.]
MDVLFIGNGINNIKMSYNWEDLLRDLILDLKISAPNNLKEKPFPLLYEEIFLNSVRQNGNNENIIKEIIRTKITQLKPNAIHQQIANTNYEHIITTNYDYILHNALGIIEADIKNIGLSKESKYSIFRHNILKSTKVWQIHGEINNLNSVTLGYEHYGGHIQHIKNYIEKGFASEKTKIEPISKRIENKIKFSNEAHSWIDLFLSRNIHFLGLTLDFIETDIWWLITHRARKRLYDANYRNNKLIYYCPEKYHSKSSAKFELLEANDVEVKFYEIDHTIEYYEKVLSQKD